jgi:hypothetical protein
MSLRFLLAAALCVLISPSVLAQALVGGDAAAVLAAHNNERARVGVSGLVWDAKLAADAAGWARVLAPLDNLVHAQNTGQGENLAMGTKGAYTAVRLVDGWLDEKKDYVPGRPFPNVSRTGNEVVGHYTQMIWADTTSVGCAMSRSANNDILVCRYSPQGNFIGRFVMPHGTATAPPVIQPPQLAGQRPPPPAATNVAGVQKFEPATIFEHINFGGKSQALVEGLNVGPLAVGNDVTSSVKVSKCWKVTLYGAGPGQKGPELVLTADNADLSKNNFNDITSNVLVERERNCDAKSR